MPEAERKSDNPAPGLENNPGKDGKLFSRKHPYFPNSCAACPFNSKPKLFALVSDLVALKDCEKCKAMLDIVSGKEEKIQQNRVEYNRLKDNPNYKDVEFNEKNGGLKATHIEHNFDKNKGWYETEVQRIGYNHGHSVILEKEDHTKEKVKNTEGTWDNLKMEIAAAETGTPNKIRNALKHCASKPNADVAVVFYPNTFSEGAFENGLGKYNGLKGTNQYREFKKIICINGNKIIIK